MITTPDVPGRATCCARSTTRPRRGRARLDRGRPASGRTTRRTRSREARRLWRLVGPAQPVHQDPGHRAGLPAITACLAEGISVNVTLIFSRRRYDEVMDAFLDGIERARAGRPRPEPDRVGGLVLRQPRRHRDRPAPRRDRHRRGRRRCAARRRSPTPGWPSAPTRDRSPPTAGTRSPRPEPARSARCGPRPA